MAWRVTDGLDGELEDPYADDPKGTQRMGSFAYAKFETDFSLPPPPRTRWPSPRAPSDTTTQLQLASAAHADHTEAG